MTEAFTGTKEVHHWVDVSGNTFTFIQYVTTDPDLKDLMQDMWEVDERAHQAEGLRRIEDDAKPE